MVSEYFNYIGYGNLEYYVHTAFEVKSETNLRFKTLLVRINTQILYRILVILLCHRVFNLCCLTVVVVCGY